MDSLTELEYGFAMKQLEQFSPMPLWSLCAGCGGGHRFLEALKEVLRGVYNCNLDFPAKLFCEHDKSKQDWLMQQMDALRDGSAVLVGELKSLASDTCEDINQTKRGWHAPDETHLRAVSEGTWRNSWW